MTSNPDLIGRKISRRWSRAKSRLASATYFIDKTPLCHRHRHRHIPTRNQMSALVVENTPIPITYSPPCTSPGSSIPIVDLAIDSLYNGQQIVSNAATSTGLVFVRNLPRRPAFLAVRRLFDVLYRSPSLASRLNNIYSKRGVFKIAGILTDDETVDEKATIDLSAQRLQGMNDAALRQELGEEFEETVKFFQIVEEKLVPLILTATSHVISSSGQIDLNDIHRDGNNNFRLIDYHASSPHRHGCGEHTDYGTATIIFQDGSGGLEVQDPSTKEWRAVPGYETVVMWGWCGHILSGGKIRAVKHRIQTVHSTRRNTAVCFIAPDLRTPLRPLVPGNHVFAGLVARGDVTVEEFKESMGKTWRWREGTERKDVEAPSMCQDDAIIEFLYGCA